MATIHRPDRARLAIGIFPRTFAGSRSHRAAIFELRPRKKLSRHPERFGSGEIEGVASPEACNNAAVGGTFIPLLSLGIPSNAMTAILLGALMIYGLTPGPLLIKNSPDLFWGVIASMYIGNIMLLILNLPLIPMWVSVLKIPYSYLSCFIILFCLIGAYSLNNSTTDIYIAVIFSLVGLLMKNSNSRARRWCWPSFWVRCWRPL